MRRILLTAMVLLAPLMIARAAWDGTNDFYDDAPTADLGRPRLIVNGEVADPGPIDLSRMPLRSAIVKETRLTGDTAAFVGAYRYDGYSLYDILDRCVVRKKNEQEFPRAIDVFVVVSNAAGDQVVLSWGEIYYPNDRHRILVATRVARIVPSKTKDLWPLPRRSRLVVGPDLVSDRNIDEPTTITVRSYPRSFPPAGETSNLHSPVIHVYHAGSVEDSITAGQRFGTMAEYPTVFYGRGKGIHGISRFRGAPLKSLLAASWSSSVASLRRGLVTVAALDGYRSVFTYAEIFNRNDQNEVLLVPRAAGQEGGAYSLFAPADFFSDRAVKAVTEIRYDLLDSLVFDR
ncbi:hypothetical protein EG831_07865 [bacterium]|nr:hypothetical protein [bacterium]